MSGLTFWQWLFSWQKHTFLCKIGKENRVGRRFTSLWLWRCKTHFSYFSIKCNVFIEKYGWQGKTIPTALMVKRLIIYYKKYYHEKSKLKCKYLMYVPGKWKVWQFFFYFLSTYLLKYELKQMNNMISLQLYVDKIQVKEAN